MNPEYEKSGDYTAERIQAHPENYAKDEIGRPTRPIFYSESESIHFLKYEDINGQNRFFGGKLVAWIDELANIVAKRHSGTYVTTAAIDNLQFKKAAFLNDMVVLVGKVTYVGNSSMEVRVDTYRESREGTRQAINRAYLTIVALDENSNPTKIPYGLLLRTENERMEWEGAKKRIALRKERRKDGY